MSVLYTIESSLLLFWELMNTHACTRCYECPSSHPPCNRNIHCLVQTKSFLSSYFFLCDIPCILLFFCLFLIFLISCVTCLLLLSYSHFLLPPALGSTIFCFLNVLCSFIIFTLVLLFHPSHPYCYLLFFSGAYIFHGAKLI